MGNNIANPFFVSDGLGSKGCVKAHPAVSITVDSLTNAVICGADSLVITLTSTSNSPVYITCIDGVTPRASCTILITTEGVTQDWTLTTSASSAWCVRMGEPSTNSWAVIGAATAG